MLYRSAREDEDKSYNSFSSYVRIYEVRLREAVPSLQELTLGSEETVRHIRAWNIRTDKHKQKTYQMHSNIKCQIKTVAIMILNTEFRTASPLREQFRYKCKFR